MSFNSDPSKQAQEVILSRKLQKLVYLPLHFNDITVTQSTTQEHLGMHLKNIYSKVNKAKVYYTSFMILYRDCLY